MFDTLPSSLMDLTASPKVTTMEGKGVEAHSLVCSTLGVKGRVRAPGWRQGRLTSKSITYMNMHKPNNKLVSANWNTFGARTSHRQIWIHKIHHNPDLGEAITFPLIVFSMSGHGASTQLSFCLWTLKWESRNSQN
jgi:hypothetical protein